EHDSYAVHDLDGGQGTAFAWDDARGWAQLRCSPHDTSRCVVWSHVAQTASFAPLGDTHAPITVDGNTATSIDVSPEGHVLTGTIDGDVVDLDPASGARTVLAHVAAPDCVIRHTRYADDGAWVVLLCPDRFAIAHVLGSQLEEAVASAGWISGI